MTFLTKAFGATDSFTAWIATSRDELTAAYELAYRSYCKKGFLRPDQGGRLIYRPAFALPGSRTLVAASAAGPIAGTLTVVGDNPGGMHLELAYRQEVRALRQTGRRLAEITCLAMETANARQSMALFFVLTKFAIHFASWRGHEDLLLAIHPRHRRFYQRVFGAQTVGPIRAHPGVQGHPAVCCRVDLKRMAATMEPEQSRQFFSNPPSVEQFAAAGLSREDHRHFCRCAGVRTLNAASLPGSSDARAA